MKRLLLIIAFILSVLLPASAQEKQYEDIVGSFVESYRSDQYNTFYDFFSSELKASLPIDEAIVFYRDMKSKLGGIISVSYYGLDEDGYALYTTKFENGTVLLLNLSINEAGQLLGFRLIDMPNDVARSSEFMEVSYEDLIYQAGLALPNNGQFAIALIDDVEVDYIGLKRRGESVSIVDNKTTLFSIGNFNMLFTSALLANAINEKKMGISDAVNTYYPFQFNDSIQLSFASLANNSTFLPILPIIDQSIVNLSDQDAYFFQYSTADLVKDLQFNIVIDSVNMERRTRFSYLGYAILGETLSRVYNQDYSVLINQKVFEPYKMKSTSFVGKKSKILPGIDMYNTTVYPSNFNLLRTSTGGFSTLEDLTKFVQANLDPNNADLKLLQKPTLMINKNFWGTLGWRISNPTQPDRIVYFSRGIEVGYCNYIGFSPKHKKGIVILSNSSTTETLDAMDELAYKLMHKLLDLK